MELPGADVQRILELTDRLAEQKKIDTDKHWQELSGRIRREERKGPLPARCPDGSRPFCSWPVLLLSGLLFIAVEGLAGAAGGAGGVAYAALDCPTGRKCG